MRIGYSRKLGLYHVNRVPLLAGMGPSRTGQVRAVFSYLRFIAPGQLRSANDYNLSVIHDGA
jgi:hypothetical protein